MLGRSSGAQYLVDKPDLVDKPGEMGIYGVCAVDRSCRRGRCFSGKKNQPGRMPCALANSD